ncbi:Hypothetical_protein [Hexamita inflata]|uniref:Hypothetical_protein n=1 Tax=Hexamita inflata TaxID=28002 RepID=A0ABP1HCA4_9EUKA
MYMSDLCLFQNNQDISIQTQTNPRGIQCALLFNSIQSSIARTCSNDGHALTEANQRNIYGLRHVRSCVQTVLAALILHIEHSCHAIQFAHSGVLCAIVQYVIQHVNKYRELPRTAGAPCHNVSLTFWNSI